MPTGYTAAIADDISFEDFVLKCARAMGALVMMRDDSSDTPIPDKFDPSDYYQKQLKSEKKALAKLQLLTKEEIEKCAQTEYDEDYKAWQKYENEKKSLKTKYENMLQKVKEWNVGENFFPFKDFMIDQIEQSINWDCSEYPAPVKLTPTQWYDKKIEKLNWSIDYHIKGHEKEVENAKERTDWIKELKAAL